MTNILPRLAAASIFGSLVGMSMAPSAANAGFLEQLFGVPEQPQAPAYQAEQPPQYQQDAPVRVHPPRKRVVVDAKPKLQKPTDLMHDATLQRGDAVMMKDGIHIYTGDDDTTHSKRDFAPLDATRAVTKQERRALVAMDTTRNDPLRGEIAPDDVASGRSASVATPIVSGQKIVDAKGKSLRYVGP